MKRFCALFKSTNSNESMLVLAFRFSGIVKPGDGRKMKTDFWRTWEFPLARDEVDKLRREFGFTPGTDPDGTKAITAYILNEIPHHGYVLVRVDEIAEPVPADAAPDDRIENCSCPLHNPANKDPWGYRC